MVRFTFCKTDHTLDQAFHRFSTINPTTTSANKPAAAACQRPVVPVQPVEEEEAEDQWRGVREGQGQLQAAAWDPAIGGLIGKGCIPNLAN